MTLDLQAISTTDPAKGFAVDRQLTRMRKRAEIARPELRSKAEAAFVELNDSLPDTLEIDPCIQEAASDFIRHVLEGYVKSIDTSSLQECFSWSFIFDNWAFGPGASNGVKGIGTVEKMGQPMTCTESAVPWVKQLRLCNPYFRCFDATHESQGTIVVQGSRLTTVLKNEDEERTIAIEPSGNMAFQLAGGRLIEGALRRIGLDIGCQQEINKRLARSGSIRNDLATVDLKKASDRQIPDLSRQLWPKEWHDFFMKFRSRSTQLPSGRAIDLRMLSTMGNGFTFPFMTLTLLSLVYANRLVNFGGPFRFIDLTNTAVFGDDIIVPSAEYSSLCSVLHGAGYIVNTDKSYAEGDFRESCGGDYFKGVDVTPFYVRRLTAPESVYVAINQVLRWSARWEIPMFRSLKYLISLLNGKIYLVPEWSDDFAGIRTSQCQSRYKLLKARRVEVPYDGIFSMPLACGGYLSSSRRNGMLCGYPSDKWVTYNVGTSRLPKGYLDGWDPRYGTQRFSNYISLMVSLVS